MADDPSEPFCCWAEGHDWCSPSALGFSEPRAETRGDTTVSTYFCKHDCGHQRIIETDGSGAQKVYYLRGDFFFH